MFHFRVTGFVLNFYLYRKYWYYVVSKIWYAVILNKGGLGGAGWGGSDIPLQKDFIDWFFLSPVPFFFCVCVSQNLCHYVFEKCPRVKT